MTDIPAIFTAPMVLALLDGRKTETRRNLMSPIKRGGTTRKGPTHWNHVGPGDRIWVRETFGVMLDGTVGFTAGSDVSLAELRDAGVKITPPIFMPRTASRLTLIVTATRIERLQDITEEGAEAEAAGTPETAKYRLTRMAYAKLWESINGLASWQANPWVVVVQFQVKRANIDKLGDSADGRPEQEAGGQRPEPVRAEP